MIKREDDFLRLKADVAYGGVSSAVPVHFMEPLPFDDEMALYNFTESLVGGRILDSLKNLYIRVFSGEEIAVEENRFHVRASRYFIEKDEVAAQKVMKRLLNGVNYSPRPDFTVNLDLDSLAIENLRPLVNYSSNDFIEFDGVVSSRVRYTASFDKTWNPSFYLSPKSLASCTIPKFVWDLLHHCDELVIKRNGRNQLICLVPRTIEYQLRMLGYAVLNDVKMNVTDEMKFLSEFLSDESEMVDLDKLKKCQKGSALNVMHDESFLSKSALTFNMNDIECEIEYAKCMYEGLMTVKKLLRKYRSILAQKEHDMYVALGEIVARKVCLDPLLYIDDDRRYISDFARNLISGNIEVDQVMYFCEKA